jgi:hypothetical protein
MNRLRARRHEVRPTLEPADPSGAESLDWRHRAECLGEDPDMYLPANGTEPDQRAVSGA